MLIKELFEDIKKYSCYISFVYIWFTFCFIDVWLRVVTRWIGAYSIYEIEPNLFTVLWGLIITSIIFMFSSCKIRKLVYCTIYNFFVILGIVQYGSYLILGKFLFISDFLMASEGANYISYILEFISIELVLQIVFLIFLGLIGLLLLSNSSYVNKISFISRCLTIFSILGLILLPNVYEGDENETSWNNFSNPKFVYDKFLNSNFCLELMGIYQYTARDITMQLNRMLPKNIDNKLIDDYFEKKQAHSYNDMTGIYKNKNLIVVMMESIDDWLITEEDTPNMYHMMNKGINFSSFYTPQYSNGYTFNTEFAFNTSVYPYSNGNVSYSLSRNNFKKSIANAFFLNDYSVNSFHEGLPTFYNRGFMHAAFGYERYNSYIDYPKIDVSIDNDLFLTKNEHLFNDLIIRNPFFSFVITYSGHLPYNEEDPLSLIALDFYPQYNCGDNKELNILKAKAKLTDDMFGEMLKKLKEKGILDDTVIVGFTDHYSYGLSDKELLQQLSNNNGNSILERTPAFIYCSDNELKLNVDKVAQITDLAPTLLNLFGLEVPKEIMGNDIFDPSYEGYAIFPNNSWVTKEAYVKNGTIVYNNGLSEQEIYEMNKYVDETYTVNDMILDNDYYNR